MKRLWKSVLAVGAVAGLALSPVAPAQAALNYTYLAGHVMYTPTGRCTGSYTIVGTSGMFTLTAGHCGSPGMVVRGTDAAFGTIAHKKPTNQGDSLLVSVYSGVTQMQRIVDPLTGRTPGDGIVRGVMPSSQQTVGTLVGKMGTTTGWTEGTIIGTSTWYGRTVICHNGVVAGGDSGGPVWRNDQYGLRAVGMTVNRFTDRVGGCYIPIDQLLSEWGAWMPVASSAARANLAPAGAETVSPALPFIDPSTLRAADD